MFVKVIDLLNLYNQSYNICLFSKNKKFLKVYTDKKEFIQIGREWFDYELINFYFDEDIEKTIILEIDIDEDVLNVQEFEKIIQESKESDFKEVEYCE